MLQDIAIAVKQQLEEVMKEYGYQILQALVTDMDPDRRVKEAMNEINASKRLREAATNKAEADKIMQVCVFFTLNLSFNPSTSGAPSVRADSSS